MASQAVVKPGKSTESILELNDDVEGFGSEFDLAEENDENAEGGDEEANEEEMEDEEEEEDVEEESDDTLSEEEAPESPFIWRPSEEGFKESDLESRKERRYLLSGTSFLELVDPKLENALVPGTTGEEAEISEAEKKRRGLKAERDLYKDLCKNSGIAPNPTFLKALGTNILDLTNHGLTEKEVAAICNALHDDKYIEICLLSGNSAGKEGGLAIAGMINNNQKIEELNIANTEIIEVIEEIMEAACSNSVLTSLNLSKNELVNQDMMLVGNFLAESTSIQRLFLAYNEVKDGGLAELAPGLLENISLIHLDFSSNRIRGERRASPFFNACADHPQIRHLDLKRNIIRNDGAKAIARMLSNNDRIQYLDLSFNIMEEPAGAPLGRSLNIGPRELETLYLEQQWWHQQAAAAILKPFGNPDNLMPIEVVDFGFMLDVHKSFLKAKDRAQALHPEMQILYGQPYGIKKAKGPDPKSLVIRRANVVFENFNTPLVMFMEELAKEPKTLKIQEFKKFVKSCNLYKDKTLTEAFEKVFPSGAFDVDGEAILEAFDKEYPGLRVIPEPVPEEEVAEVPKKSKKTKKKGKGAKGKRKSKSPGAAAKPKTAKGKPKKKSKKSQQK